MLADNGYKVRVFNTVNFGKSMHFNPFHYIHSEKDIMKLVTTLIANTNDSTKTGGDPFWEKSETLLYMALVGYIHYELPPEDQNFASLLRLLNEMNASEETMDDVPDEDGDVHWTSNPVDVLFEELRRKKPGCFAVLQYTKFKMAASLTDKDLVRLEEVLLENPQKGDVIEGIGGARQLRIQIGNHGKSGGSRVIYLDVLEREHLYLLFAYPKNVQSDLTADQKKAIRNLVEQIKKE